MKELIIESGKAERQYWKDIWAYRELFYFLAWRDILVRYKQTTIGIAWAVIRTFLTVVISAIIFGRAAKLPSVGDVPYTLLVFFGVLPWNFFSAALTDASASVLSNGNLISKVYFPRLIVPASAIIAGLVDFAISLALLAVFMIYYRFMPDWRIIFLPLFLTLAFATAMGAGLWLAALTVKYRDFRFITPFIVQFGFYISGVTFSSKVIPDNIRLLYSLNPLVGVIDGFRWCMTRGQSPMYMPGLVISIALTSLLLWSGIRYFRATEKTFADII